MRACHNFCDSISEFSISIPTTEGIAYLRRSEERYIIAFNREFINSIGVIATAIKIVGNCVSYNIPFRINGNVAVCACFNLGNSGSEVGVSIPTTKGITRSRRIEKRYIIAFNGETVDVIRIICSSVEMIGNRVINSNPLCIQGDRCIISRKKILYTFVIVKLRSSAVCFGIPIYKSITYFAETVCL